MADVLKFTGITTIPEPVPEFLDKAKGWGMDRCAVMGFSEDNEFVFGGSFSEVGELLILLELAKRQLMAGM